MAITSWTSEGMDWSSAESLKGQPFYNLCEAVRLAIFERLSVVCAYGWGGIYQYGYYPNYYYLTPGNTPKADFADYSIHLSDNDLMLSSFSVKGRPTWED